MNATRFVLTEPSLHSQIDLTKHYLTGRKRVTEHVERFLCALIQNMNLVSEQDQQVLFHAVEDIVFTLLQQPFDSLEEVLTSVFVQLLRTSDSETQTHLFDNLCSFVENMQEAQKNTSKEAHEITEKLISRGFFHISLLMRNADDYGCQHVFEVLVHKVKNQDFRLVYRAVQYLDLKYLALESK